MKTHKIDNIFHRYLNKTRCGISIRIKELERTSFQWKSVDCKNCIKLKRLKER
jgi:hypothetical protein